MSGEQGADTGPCASAASSSWHFASGSTNREAQEILVLFNPFPDDAVVDITFATTEGFRAPQPYDGFIVPVGGWWRSMSSTVVARHDDVSASVVARRGRLVADRIQVYNGFRGQGLAVGLGQPQLSELRFFPAGGSNDGLTERFLVYNPGELPAQLDIEIYLDDPDVNGEIEPVAVTVQPQSFFAVELSGEARVPAGVAHSAIVRVHNDVAVAVERESFGDRPVARHGVAITPGSPLLGDTWVLAAGEAGGSLVETVTLFNPTLDEGISRVRMVPLDGSGEGGPDPGRPRGAAGRPATVPLADHLNSESLALMVEATQPDRGRADPGRHRQSGHVPVARRAAGPHHRAAAAARGLSRPATWGRLGSMEQLLVAAGLAVVVGAVALVLRRRAGSDRPTQPRQVAVPAQLDRADFDRPDAPWLVVVFSSSTCLSCADTWAKASQLESDTVAVAGRRGRRPARPASPLRHRFRPRGRGGRRRRGRPGLVRRTTERGRPVGDAGRAARARFDAARLRSPRDRLSAPTGR